MADAKSSSFFWACVWSVAFVASLLLTGAKPQPAGGKPQSGAHLLLLWLVPLLCLATGCSPSRAIVGKWHAVSGLPVSLTFNDNGSFRLVLHAQMAGEPWDVDDTGSYQFTDGNHFTVLEGGAYSDGVISGNHLLITKRGGETSEFARD